MSELKNATDEINNMINKIADMAEIEAEMLFSPIEEKDVLAAEKSMKKCKKVCRTVGIMILVICVIIIYFHLKG